MTNPLVHTLVFLAAVLIPGGLLVYFAWRAISLKGEPNQTAQNPALEDIPAKFVTPPDEAREAFRSMFPKDSLRARSKIARLDRLKAFRHRKIKK
jgi:hypothetical protein